MGGLGNAVPGFEEIAGEEGRREWGGVDLDAFADGAEVRAGVEADFEGSGVGTGMLGEDGGDEGGCAAFAFRAGYVNYVEAVEIGGLGRVSRGIDIF